jgi:hypothetical protein
MVSEGSGIPIRRKELEICSRSSRVIDLLVSGPKLRRATKKTKIGHVSRDHVTRKREERERLEMTGCFLQYKT